MKLFIYFLRSASLGEEGWDPCDDSRDERGDQGVQSEALGPMYFCLPGQSRYLTNNYIYLQLSTAIYIYIQLPTSIYIYIQLSTYIYIYIQLSTSIYIYIQLSTLYTSIYSIFSRISATTVRWPTTINGCLVSATQVFLSAEAWRLLGLVPRGHMGEGHLQRCSIP